MDSDLELMLEDARSILDGLVAHGSARPGRYCEALDARIAEEDLDGMSEAVEVREVLERLQALSIEVGEELDTLPGSARPPVSCP